MYIVFLVILVYLIWSEYGSQDCIDQKCHNKVEEVNDLKFETILGVIRNANDNNHCIVVWRRAMISAITTGIILNKIIYNSDYSLFIVITVVFGLSYIFSMKTQKETRSKDIALDNELKKLNKNIVLAQIPFGILASTESPHERIKHVGYSLY